MLAPRRSRWQPTSSQHGIGVVHEHCGRCHPTGPSPLRVTLEWDKRAATHFSDTAVAQSRSQLARRRLVAPPSSPRRQSTRSMCATGSTALLTPSRENRAPPRKSGTDVAAILRLITHRRGRGRLGVQRRSLGVATTVTTDPHRHFLFCSVLSHLHRIPLLFPPVLIGSVRRGAAYRSDCWLRAMWHPWRDVASKLPCTEG